MPVSGRVSEALGLTAALIVAAVTARAAPPERVVSLNLCTDIMAMMLAPDRLVAVSPIASDPTSSALAEEALAYPHHDGTAEAVYLLAPDLVLAGSFTERATVDMLRRLGLRVEEFPPVSSLDDMRDQMRWMGDLLGREEAAETALAEFDAALARLPSPDGSPRVAAPYFANGYALGEGTLVGAVLAAAGLRNLAADMGLSQGAILPMEQLVMARPDVIVTGERYPAASRSEAVLDHPALRSVTGGAEIVVVPDRDWICGTPHLIAAITQLAEVAAR